MKPIQKIACLIFSSLFLFSCEEESIGSTETFTPVIEAYIYAGLPVDSIRITQSISYAQEDSTANNLDDLNPVISDGTNSYLLTSIGNGYYQNLDLIIQQKLAISCLLSIKTSRSVR